MSEPSYTTLALLVNTRRCTQFVFFVFFVFCTLRCPNGNVSHGKFGSLSRRKAGGNSRAALPNLINSKVACWVFSSFRNPPNSDMDYRIFNVRTWSFSCVRVQYTHTGGWAHQQQVSTTIVTLTNLSCAPDADGVRTSGLLDLESDVLPTEPYCHPEVEVNTNLSYGGVCPRMQKLRTLYPYPRWEAQGRVARQRPSPFTAKVAESPPVSCNSAQMHWRPRLGDNLCCANHLLG